MKKEKTAMWICVLVSSVLMSLPWLVPHCGFFALFGLVEDQTRNRIRPTSGTRNPRIAQPMLSESLGSTGGLGL